MTTRTLPILLPAAVALLAAAALAQPLGTAFTYQGELQSGGTPASGLHDLRFRLYDAAAGGNQVGATLCSDNVSVADGRFTVELDFGSQFTGQQRFLEIEVRLDAGLDCGSGVGFVPLSPRQTLTATPNAVFASSANSATTALSATSAVSAGTATNALNLGGAPAGNFATLAGNQTFTGVLNFTNPANTFSGIFTGNGAGLLNLAGGSIQAGTIPRSAVGSDIENVLSLWNLASGQAVHEPLDAVAWGYADSGRTNIPALPSGVTYTQIAGGSWHSLAVRSDGTAVAWGANGFGQTNVPTLPVGVVYTQIACGTDHSLALRSDGAVVAWGLNTNDQTIVPALPAGVTYTQVAGGSWHSLAVRSDGTAIAWGYNNRSQCNIPSLPAGVVYSQVAGGFEHSLALRQQTVTPTVPSSIAGVSIGAASPPPPAGGIAAQGSMVVDAVGANTGTLDGALRFGSLGNGIGIASKQTAGGNQFGLDFFTNGTQRMKITDDGKVAIGLDSAAMPTRSKLTVVSDEPYEPGANYSIAVRGRHNGIDPNTFGVWGQQGAGSGYLLNGGAGVFGTSATSAGVAGMSASDSVAGVVGFSVSLSGGVGVLAQTETPDGTGLVAINRSSTGDAVAVRGETYSPTGYAAYFVGGRNYFSGHAGFGTLAPLVPLHVRNGTNLGISDTAMNQDELIVEATDAVIGLYSSPTGSWGSAVVLKEMSGFALVNTWGIARQTSDGDNSLRFTFGTSKDYGLNPSLLTLQPSGSASLTGTMTAAAFVGSGAGLTGLSASNLAAGTLPNTCLSGTYSNPVAFSNASNSFTGNGSGLTSLDASNLASGTLADARLSSNVARLNNVQTFSGVKTFSAAPAFTAAGAPFSVGSTSLVSGLNADLLDGYHASAFLQVVPNPLALNGSTSGAIISGTNTSTAAGSRGVHRESTGASGATVGVHGESASTAGVGVRGVAMASTGSAWGGHFTSASTSGRGVIGEATAATGAAYGGLFTSTSTSGRGVYGSASATTGSTYGGYFESDSTSGYGVYGRNSASSGTIYGVRGYAITAAGGYAVYAAGDMGASGVKPFRIDHPADPENKYLLHYAAESPEVINFYRGTAALDGLGEAVVELPACFASINTNPTYQLTAVGAPMPMLHVAEKISSEALRAGERTAPGEPIPVCSFRIAGGVPGGEVSWEVKAVRHDLRMRLHGAPVEREKAAPERGKYQHPEYYGQPPERGMDHHAGAEIADSKESNR